MATIKQRIDNVTENVTDGKQDIASAITDKGVTTSSSATFSTMANNIRAIEAGAGHVICDAFDDGWSYYDGKNLTQAQVDAFEIAKQAYADGKIMVQKSTYDILDCTPIAFQISDDESVNSVLKFTYTGIEILETENLSTSGKWLYNYITVNQIQSQDYKSYIRCGSGDGNYLNIASDGGKQFIRLYNVGSGDATDSGITINSDYSFNVLSPEIIIARSNDYGRDTSNITIGNNGAGSSNIDITSGERGSVNINSGYEGSINLNKTQGYGNITVNTGQYSTFQVRQKSYTGSTHYDTMTFQYPTSNNKYISIDIQCPYGGVNIQTDNALNLVGDGVQVGGPSGADVINGLNVQGDIRATGTITPGSDRKLKEDIRPLEDGVIDKIMKLKPSRYVLRDDETKKEQIGFIAQEVEEVFPEFVVEGKDGTKYLDYMKMTAILCKAIQELHK